MRDLVRFWAILAIPWVAGASCGSNGDDSGNVGGSIVPGRAWRCSASGDSCTCFAYNENEVVAVLQSLNAVPRCDNDACCLLMTPPGAPYDAECECFASDACDAEAASRRNTVVSATCPPEAEQEPVRCAAQGENCRTEYLRDNDLEGCCDGMICRTTDAVPTCQPGS